MADGMSRLLGQVSTTDYRYAFTSDSGYLDDSDGDLRLNRTNVGMRSGGMRMHMRPVAPKGLLLIWQNYERFSMFFKTLTKAGSVQVLAVVQGLLFTFLGTRLLSPEMFGEL